MSEVSLTDKPDILLMLHENLPNSVEAKFREQMNLSGLNLVTLRQPGGPYAGIELYLPTAVALFVAVGFFNGVLQEAGKDAYITFKAAAASLWKRSREIKLTNIGSAGKVSSGHRFSLNYSITGEISSGLNFKLVIRTECLPDEAESAINAFFDLIDDLLNDRVAESDMQALLTYEAVAGTVLVTFDAAARKIVPVNAFDH